MEENRKPLFDIEVVRNATHFSRKHLEEWIRNAERAWIDEDRDAREAQQKCRWCWYARSTRISGQGFTNRSCNACGLVVTYPTTDTSPLCMDCAKKHGVCVDCCADLSLGNRRKLDKQIPYMGKSRKPGKPRFFPRGRGA